jgi:hypothetical protein
MGTQQILLLVLVVVIVGIAFTVGISIFMNEGYNSNKQMLASEMVTYPPSVIRFWKSTKILGGAGGDLTYLTQVKVANYLGFTGANYSQTSQNGEFRVFSVANGVVTLKAKGVEKKGGKYPFVTTTITVATSVIASTITDATTW